MKRLKKPAARGGVPAARGGQPKATARGGVRARPAAADAGGAAGGIPAPGGDSEDDDGLPARWLRMPWDDSHYHHEEESLEQDGLIEFLGLGGRGACGRRHQHLLGNHR